MKIYELNNDINKFKWFGRIHSNDTKYDYEFDILFEMRGQSIIKNWKPIEINAIVESKEDALLLIGDYPKFDEPLISEDALDILLPFMKKYIELLDIKILGEKLKCNYYLLNVLNILDCLDLNKSMIDWASDSSGITNVKEYTFKEDQLKNSFIFRIKGYEKNIYVNEEFKNLVDKNNLQGF